MRSFFERDPWSRDAFREETAGSDFTRISREIDRDEKSAFRAREVSRRCVMDPAYEEFATRDGTKRRFSFYPKTSGRGPLPNGFSIINGDPKTSILVNLAKP